MIRLRCYEPAGRVLELAPDDLTRHVIAFGATGSGKTTALINPVLRQLIGWRSSEASTRVGLLVLDPKGDDSVQKIQAYAREAGRQSDLVCLSPGGEAWYDLLGGFERLDQTQAFANRLLLGTRDLGANNAYWTETRNGLVETALVLVLANGRPVRFADAIDFMQAWWFSSDSSQIEPKLEFVRRLLNEGKLGTRTHRRLELALTEAGNWTRLDSRTRELHRSTLQNVLRPLLSSAAHSLFEPKGAQFHPLSVLHGKILVVSVDAISHPELARLLFRIIRQDFYAAVQSRAVVRPERDRLCGLIADELPLSAMPEDVQTLSIIRAKGGFVVAAAQSLNGLDEVLGWRGREALVANFNSVFFFSARENALDEYACLALGTRERHKTKDVISSDRDVLVEGRAESIFREPVCPPGTLARLKQHQAYAKLADGTVTELPAWLEPSFFDAPSVQPALAPDELAEAVTNLKERVEPDVNGMPSFLLHMHRSGHPFMTTPNIVSATWLLCIPRVSRNEVLRDFGRRIPGVRSLPSCWVAGLYHWLARYPSAATKIAGVELRSGVLWPKLQAFNASGDERAVLIPESLNLFIYPSLWRPLQPRHRAQLLLDRPDLREEILSLPKVSSRGK